MVEEKGAGLPCLKRKKRRGLEAVGEGRGCGLCDEVRAGFEGLGLKGWGLKWVGPKVGVV